MHVHVHISWPGLFLFIYYASLKKNGFLSVLMQEGLAATSGWSWGFLGLCSFFPGHKAAQHCKVKYSLV